MGGQRTRARHVCERFEAVCRGSLAPHRCSPCATTPHPPVTASPYARFRALRVVQDQRLLLHDDLAVEQARLTPIEEVAKIALHGGDQLDRIAPRLEPLSHGELTTKQIDGRHVIHELVGL